MRQTYDIAAAVSLASDRVVFFIAMSASLVDRL